MRTVTAYDIALSNRKQLLKTLFQQHPSQNYWDNANIEEHLPIISFCSYHTGGGHN